MTRKEKLLQDLIITLAGLTLMFVIVWFGLDPASTSAAAAPTLTPTPVVMPTPGNNDQASIFWGDTLNLLCYEDAQAKEQHEPSGILNFDVTDSGVVAITCRQPGTAKDGQ